jgi:hypothetical protein
MVLTEQSFFSIHIERGNRLTPFEGTFFIFYVNHVWRFMYGTKQGRLFSLLIE